MCTETRTVPATVTQGSPRTQDFEAFVGDDVAGDGQPGLVVVSGNEAPVTWWRFVIINPWGAPCASETAADFRFRQIRSERY